MEWYFIWDIQSSLKHLFMVYSLQSDDHHQYEKQIVRQMSAFLMLTQEGLEDACAMYPEDAEFLKENRHKTYHQVRKELAGKLERV